MMSMVSNCRKTINFFLLCCSLTSSICIYGICSYFQFISQWYNAFHLFSFLIWLFAFEHISEWTKNWLEFIYEISFSSKNKTKCLSIHSTHSQDEDQESAEKHTKNVTSVCKIKRKKNLNEDVTMKRDEKHVDLFRLCCNTQC